MQSDDTWTIFPKRQGKQFSNVAGQTKKLISTVYILEESQSKVIFFKDSGYSTKNFYFSAFLGKILNLCHKKMKLQMLYCLNQINPNSFQFQEVTLQM